MSDTHDFLDDPLEPLLGAPHPAPDEAFRQALLRRTSRVVRRSRWARRAGLAAALAACYVAGVLTTHWVMPPVVVERVVVQQSPEPAPALAQVPEPQTPAGQPAPSPE